jgi:hypothetical protein
MATINIGSLTFTHKGDYASGTAYVKNDVVYYATNGNAYIAKTSTTGNAPTSTAHWDLFAAGSGGIWNAGLSLGTANQVVAVNAGANALEFQNVSSDMVKLASGTFSASASTLDIQQCFSDTYEIYKLMLHLHIGTSDGNNYPEIGFLDNSNNPMTDTYYGCGDGVYMTSGSGDARWSNGQHQDSWRQNDTNGFRLINTWQMSNENELSQAECTFFRPNRAAKVGMTAMWGASQHNYVAMGCTWGMHMTTTVRKGIRINSAGGVNFNTASKYYLYGIKP